MTGFLIIVACAIAYRLRGSELLSSIGTAGGRLVWAAVAAICLSVVLGNWWALASLPLWYGGTLLGRGRAIDLGRREGEWLVDALRLLLIGAATVALPVVLTAVVGAMPWGLLLAGLLMPLCYELGWRIPSPIKHLGQGPELGELIFGAVIGAGMVML